jgi:hypothetical protein
MVCGVIVGSLVWKLGSLTPTKAVGANRWNRPFVKLFKRFSKSSLGRYSWGRLGNEYDYTKHNIYIYTYISDMQLISSYTSAAAFRQPDGKLSSKVMQSKENELNSRNCIRYPNQAGKQDHRNQSLERGLFQFGECCAGMLLQ